MKSYKYTARDSQGTRKEGISQANSQNDVLGYLREQGFIPISVNEMAARPEPVQRQHRKRRIKSADLAALSWQLTTMVEGGIPITTAIETIAEDVENLHLQNILQQIVEKMRKGQAFSESISEYPNVFNTLACAMVLAGETSGNLPVSLRRLAEYFDNRDKLGKKVKGAMAYPVFVFSFIVIIVIFIMTFIIPRFRIMFDEFGGELPVFTRGFMAFYDVLRYNLHYIIGLLVSVIIFGIITYKTKKGHYWFCRIGLAVPLLGKISKQAFITMFCRTMSTLIGSGVPVLEVLEILSTMTKNDIIKAAIIRAKEHIVQGSNISFGLSASRFFPHMVVKMIQIGEESGSLPNVLERTSDYYERKVDAAITTATSLLEPIMIITVGAIVLVVILALYLPIFSMSVQS